MHDAVCVRQAECGKMPVFYWCVSDEVNLSSCFSRAPLSDFSLRMMSSNTARSRFVLSAKTSHLLQTLAFSLCWYSAVLTVPWFSFHDQNKVVLSTVQVAAYDPGAPCKDPTIATVLIQYVVNLTF